ncbi:hypothetical protein RYX45_21985, partial [Alkalihalophilus pseudofirmus]
SVALLHGLGCSSSRGRPSGLSPTGTAGSSSGSLAPGSASRIAAAVLAHLGHRGLGWCPRR